MAPSNMSQTFAMDGGANLPASTRFTAKGSMGYMRQNEDLQPFTINSALPTGNSLQSALNPSSAASLPEQSANATVMTWTQDYALKNRFYKPLSLGIHYHSYQMINRTSEVDFAGQALGDSSWSTNIVNGAIVPFTNNRFEFRKDTLEGSADYQLLESLSLGVNYGTEWDHRTDREVTNTTEKSLKADVDYSPLRWVQVRGSYLNAHRRPQDFDSTAYLNSSGTVSASLTGAAFTEQPGLRRYDVADRLRNQGKVLFQVSPGPVTVGVNASLTHDNFQPGVGDLTGQDVLVSTYIAQATNYGLLEDRDASVGIDVAWDMTERLGFSVYYDYEQTEAFQRSDEDTQNGTSNSGQITQNSKNDWMLRELARYQMTGIAATVGKKTDRVTWRLAYDVTMSRSGTDYSNVGSLVFAPATYTNAVAGVPTDGSLISPAATKYMKQDISVRTNIKLSDHVSMMLGYLFEKYDVSDWQNQNIPVVGGTAAAQTNIYLGTNLQNYVAHVGTVLLKYKF